MPHPAGGDPVNLLEILHDPSPEVVEAARRLGAWFTGRGRVLIAYSGGVDSALVAFAARRILGREGALAVIADSPSLPRRELEAALAFAAARDIPCRTVPTAEGEQPDYIANGPDRCYWCKQELYSVLSTRFDGGRWDLVVNGTNADDPGEWRPGLKAAEQWRVASPLLECGLGKGRVRELACALGLEVWDKPAAPCLASRIPYGSAVTPARLAVVEAAEEVLRDEGMRSFRVRHLGETARLELGVEELARLAEPGRLERITAGVRAAGFTEVVLDPAPLRSGRLNEEPAPDLVGVRRAGPGEKP
jgi:uncharacterized protein